ncbi:unnamed protein product [Dicrocoelium dendriticum]|nr:unnamed protein product [Dicrocoelium dendriticum]
MILLSAKLRCKLKVQVYPTLNPNKARWSVEFRTASHRFGGNTESIWPTDPTGNCSKLQFGRRNEKWCVAPLMLNNEYAMNELLECAQAKDVMNIPGQVLTTAKFPSPESNCASPTPVQLFHELITKFETRNCEDFPLVKTDSSRSASAKRRAETDQWNTTRIHNIQHFGLIQIELWLSHFIYTAFFTTVNNKYVHKQPNTQVPMQRSYPEPIVVPFEKLHYCGSNVYRQTVKNKISDMTLLNMHNCMNMRCENIHAATDLISQLSGLRTTVQFSRFLKTRLPGANADAMLSLCLHGELMQQTTINQVRLMCEKICNYLTTNGTMHIN